MAKRKYNKKQVKKAVKLLKKLPGWVWAFVGGFLLCALIFLAVQHMQGKDVIGMLNDGMTELDSTLTKVENWLYGDESIVINAGPAEGTLRVDVIDVGQGESILITTSEKSVLIDAGENGQGDEVLAHLASLGIEKLDLAIGTHAHSDHIGGIDEVMKEIPVSEFWMGMMPESLVPSTKTYMDVLEQLDIGRTPYREPEIGTQYDLGGGGVLTVIGPVGTPGDLNNCSLVCRVDFGESSFLFSGDTEEAMERNILATGVDLDVDVMTMGHHGSDTSSSNAYFKAASPEYAAISCGEGNSYGHPHSSTLKKLKNADVIYRRTDLNGTITFITNGNTIEYSSEK